MVICSLGCEWRGTSVPAASVPKNTMPCFPDSTFTSPTSILWLGMSSIL